eukprot:1739961-Rhodomonas_salina.2
MNRLAGQLLTPQTKILVLEVVRTKFSQTVRFQTPSFPAWQLSRSAPRFVVLAQNTPIVHSKMRPALPSKKVVRSSLGDLPAKDEVR